jgi:hypothetical protein
VIIETTLEAIIIIALSAFILGIVIGASMVKSNGRY